VIRSLLLALLLLAACQPAAPPALAPAPSVLSPPPVAALQIRGERVPGAPENGVGGCQIRRDRRGHIARSGAVLHQFKVRTGYPHGRPGFQIDHVWPLKRGGCDCVDNLQWLSVADKARKDAIE
jgi:hypothetical protein